jgi:hypothetical protein
MIRFISYGVTAIVAVVALSACSSPPQGYNDPNKLAAAVESDMLAQDAAIAVSCKNTSMPYASGDQVFDCTLDGGTGTSDQTYAVNQDGTSYFPVAS